MTDLVRGVEERRREKTKELISENGNKKGKEAGVMEEKPDFVDDLVEQAKGLRERLVNAVGGMQEGDVLGEF